MQPDVSVHTLIVNAQAGGRAAFEALIDRCSERTASLIQPQIGPRLNQKIDAEDLVQETFVQVLQSLPKFTWQGEEEFWRWLQTISRHVVQMEARKRKTKKRRSQPKISLQQPVHAPDGAVVELVNLLRVSGVSPSRTLRRNERFERLREAMSSPKAREVLFLAHVQQLPLKEVGKRMGRSPKAVSMLLLRALLKLKNAFGETESIHLPDRS